MRAQEKQYGLSEHLKLRNYLGGHRRRWWNNIKMDLQDMRYESAACRPSKLSS
jgi:hypothetical protein